MTFVPFYWVDAFTSAPFGGNPAAVCLLGEPLEEATMQDLAAEFGISETAFVWPEGDDWRLRWFTPKSEVRLCGHATVGAATALWAHYPGLSERLLFQTLSGPLGANRVDGAVELVFPARPASACDPPEGLLESLGLKEERLKWCGRDSDDYLLVLTSEEDVEALAPDINELQSVETRGVICTAPSRNTDRDFVSRFFAPRVGVPEDPVTGSAHCCLAPFWAKQLKRSNLRAEQLSLRGGRLDLELRGDRVAIRGHSHLLVSGQLHLA